MEEKVTNSGPFEIDTEPNPEEVNLSENNILNETESNKKERKFNPLLPLVILLLLIILGGFYYVYVEFLKPQMENENINETTNTLDTIEESSDLDEEEYLTQNFSYVKKSFDLTSFSDMAGTVVMQNEILIPSTWSFTIAELPSGTFIQECKKYTITSNDLKMVVTITPKCSSSSISSIPRPNGEIVGTYTTVANDGITTISVVRLSVNSSNHTYVQGSSLDGSEIEYRDSFLVQRHGSATTNGDPVFWVADINIVYTGNESNAKTYLEIVDTIVLSLQIK
jgi:hypothetical protein